MDSISKELGIPRNYIKRYQAKKNRVLILVHKDWLALLLKNNVVPEFIVHESLIGDEVQSLFYVKEEHLTWRKILVNIINKPDENEVVIPLTKARVVNSRGDGELSYAQLLHYISETNFKNSWKHFYKKYIGEAVHTKNKEFLRGNSQLKNNEILVEIIRRYYGCNIISGNKYSPEFYIPSHKQNNFESHSNILPALCTVETKHCFFVLHHMNQIATLKECLTFSPTLIITSYIKPLFIIYQLLQVMKNSHDRGLIFGNICLDDIFISDSLFIQVIPDFQGNVCKLADLETETPDKTPKKSSEKADFFPSYNLFRRYNVFPSFPPDSNQQTICNKWLNREITNFDYLMYLNHVAGRRFGDPSCHFIMPWVSDFATRTNGTWRDLSKSKFRLNKGDRQLDLTYESAINSSQVPHHVSDVLSEITYYVYLSRRTPRSLLCKHVRSVWVPAEYPSSIQRLQEWTPDECIPEFFYDPTIFKSIHEDLPDLELPHWALTPEEFIEAHRECLESKHVSERLHHWIDLTFGYKLSGAAAVKAKNVCLHLVESHKQLKTFGIVQLFSYPHPPRQVQLQYFEKIPPKTLLVGESSRQQKSPVPHFEKTGTVSDDEGQSSGNGEDDSFGAKNSPLLLSKLINRSKGSLMSTFQTSTEEASRSDQGKSTSSNSTSNSINLPKDFNPFILLASVESNQSFFIKTFLSRSDNSYSTRARNGKPTVKQTIATKRIQEMQVLGCLIVEMFLQSKIRVVDTVDLDKRLRICLNFLDNESLPRCVRSAVSLLLQPFRDFQNYPYITCAGLPPPSAHQLLQPLLSSFAFPFPCLFPVVYPAVRDLVSCSNTIEFHSLWNPQDGRIRDALNLLKVRKLSVDLDKIWEESLSVKNNLIIELVLPFLKELFEDPSTSKLSVILFLDKLCRSLGPSRTNELLLDTIVNLYNLNELYLYHKNFLLILIVRCGLKVFLENFIGPLMEAVGRYKDSSSDWNDWDEGKEEESEEEMNSTSCSEACNDRETEVFTIDSDESFFNDEERVVEQAIEQLDSNDEQARDESLSSRCGGAQSSEINIPGNRQKIEEEKERSGSYQKNAFERFEFVEAESVDLSRVKAYDVAGDSMVWLAHRLGPVLTSRYLTRNLLRVLSLSYTGKDNLEPYKFTETDDTNLWKLSVLKWKVVGDENADTVLRVLGKVSEIYGEQIILLQYLPFMSKLIDLSKRKFTLGVEGGVIGCLSLLKFIVPYMNDATLMDQLKDVILKCIINPVVRLVSSTRFTFPSGQRGRYTLVSKLIDCLYLISLRIGAEMTKVHLAVPALQGFFTAFSKAHGVNELSESNQLEQPPPECGEDEDLPKEESSEELPERGLSHAADFVESGSCEGGRDRALVELKNVFDAQLAHQCYGAFFRFLGESAMSTALDNQSLIRDLYCRHEQEQSVYGLRGQFM